MMSTSRTCNALSRTTTLPITVPATSRKQALISLRCVDVLHTICIPSTEANTGWHNDSSQSSRLGPHRHQLSSKQAEIHHHILCLKPQMRSFQLHRRLDRGVRPLLPSYGENDRLRRERSGVTGEQGAAEGVRRDIGSCDEGRGVGSGILVDRYP